MSNYNSDEEISASEDEETEKSFDEDEEQYESIEENEENDQETKDSAERQVQSEVQNQKSPITTNIDSETDHLDQQNNDVRKSRAVKGFFF